MLTDIPGAGKTTLIEILAGKGKGGIISGTVSFPFESADGQTAPRIGFVPQQDILPPTLTVYETFLFAARLRLPEHVSDLDKKARVDELLEKLGINHVRDTRIGDVSGGKARGISGGEMRRVTIGLELIASPDVLLLDEPTSGLDSVSAARIANVLHAIAHDPVNPIPVIASIHQPRYALSFLLRSPFLNLPQLSSLPKVRLYPPACAWSRPLFRSRRIWTCGTLFSRRTRNRIDL